MSRTPDDIYDELLVLESRAGDGAAFRRLVDRWQPRLLRLAWRLTGDREAARDLVQDAWVGVVRGLRRLDDPARFGPWAYRIVSNRCADWTRRQVVRREAVRALQSDVEDAGSESPSNPKVADQTARLRAALAALPNEHQAVLTLHYLDGLGVAQVARILNVPVGTVKSRLHHARNRLREAMERIRT